MCNPGNVSPRTMCTHLPCGSPFGARPCLQCFIVLQRAPCALDNGASATVSTQAEHDALLLFISELADNIIRAQLLNDIAAAMFLTDQVPDSMFVQSAELTPECYK